ncbi:TRAP transporter substrate-binding protein [Desulfallas sp. Bu1-1]|uniref:TRAP transporter substrate-binding protein n=1 Tax=Desulfallas sp. Bu1-1 TaxID=2787620 RepID=UPI0028BF392C|nr:TRAP transporter substrate-binding protein [Desulfallas sp. Bu1-1]
MKGWQFRRSWRLFARGNGMVLLLLAAAMLLALTGCSSGAKESQQGQPATVELKLAHFFPSTHPAETELIQPWARAIEEATGGQVKITSYPGETLLKADAIYDGVVTGIADIGLSCFSYTRGRFPVLEVFELPGITYNNSKVASKVAWEGIKKLNPEEVQDTKLMMVLTTGPGDLFTKVPVRSLDDLKGLEVRATGLSAKTLEALGATPVAMPQSEAYEALAKGVVKGNLSPVEVLKGWKHAEVTDYLTRTPFLYNTLFFITMNLDKWNALSPEVQQAIEKVNEKYFEEVAMGLWDKQNEAALKWAVEETGMKVINLSDEETQRWIKLVEPIQEEFVAKMDAKGLNGREILNTVKELADKYNQEYK